MRIRLSFLLILLLASGCNPQPGGTSVPSPSVPTATAPPAPVDTPSPSPSPTLVPARTVVTEFFYWYDPATGGHIGPADPLSLTLPDGLLPDWRDPAWFLREFADMSAAGVDIAACGYWPGEGWADRALPNMVTALDELAAEGLDPPGLAMFYETVPLWGGDLTGAYGQAFLFANVRNFFAAIPERHWGRIDGRPVIWFYDTGGGNIRYDQGSFDFLYARFTDEFGVPPYIVVDRSWVAEQPLSVDAVYTWGVAFLGFQPRDEVAGAGPGYDDHLIPSRTEPIIVPRAGGDWYERNLYFALASGRDILWLETWNEHHEASGINHTAEYGRLYIDITRRYVDMFRLGIVPPRPPMGPYESVCEVSALFAGADGQWDGLRLLDVPGDGLWRAVEAGGQSARQTTGSAPGRYLYFDLDDGFAFFDLPVDVRIEVEFFDQGGGELILEYDDCQPGQPDRLEDRYRPLVVASIGESGRWRTAAINLRGVRFANGQNGGADFRLWAGEGHDLIARRVTVTRNP